MNGRFLISVMVLGLLVGCGGGGSDRAGTGSDTITDATPPNTSQPTPPTSPPTSPSTPVTTPPSTPKNNNVAPSISGNPTIATELKSYRFAPTISDANDDTLTLSITNKPEWLAFNASNGELSGTPQAKDVGIYNNIILRADDGKLSTEFTFNLTVNYDPIEEALRTENVSFIHTDTQLHDAILANFDAKKHAYTAAKAHIFNLTTDGKAKADSLTAINWDPDDASIINPTFGINESLFITNATSKQDSEAAKQSIGVIGEKEGLRYVALGTNPARAWKSNDGSSNVQMDIAMQNTFSWLTQRDDLNEKPFNIVIAHQGNSYVRDQSNMRQWLDAFYPETAKYNAATACNADKLAACLTDETDVLVLSEALVDESDIGVTVAAVKTAIQKKIPIFYTQRLWWYNDFAKQVFPLLNIQHGGHLYWSRLTLNNADMSKTVNTLPDDMQHIYDMVSHFKNNSFTLSLANCENRSCPEDSKFDDEFGIAANTLRSQLAHQERSKVNVFESADLRHLKLLVLLGDFYRQQWQFPLDKTSADELTFLQALYGDYSMVNQRRLNPVPQSLGNFSRTDFSHVTPVNKAVALNTTKGNHALGAYVLPNKTVTIKRTDNNALATKIYINTVRDGATHTFDQDGYTRPRFVTSQQYSIAPNETLTLTSATGGTLQVNLSEAGEATFALTNVGEHPYWKSEEDTSKFTTALENADYDWAEVVTPQFEVHSKLDKLKKSIYDKGYNDVAELAKDTRTYMTDFTHVLAGYKGENVSVEPEVHDFAEQHGLEIHTFDSTKHMNADQASCGSGCSGNPYDAYWSYGPLDIGDLHELGHGLEHGRFKFDGFPGHSLTNHYGYYSKQRYFKTNGKHAGSRCHALPFEDWFTLLQASQKTADPIAHIEQANFKEWNHGAAIIIQIMMAAQAEGVVKNGWHVYGRLHVIFREFNAADDKDDTWAAKRDGLGFKGMEREVAKSLSNNDWLLIAYSHAAQRDMRDYFTMWGLRTSEVAQNHVATLGYKSMPAVFYTAKGRSYCETLDFPALAVDGKQEWPAD